MRHGHPRDGSGLPGSTHDLTTTRTPGIVGALTGARLKCWADQAYQEAGGPVRVPFRGRRARKWKRRHNSGHARIRCLGEQAMATLKAWRLLRKFRCSTNRITDERYVDQDRAPPSCSTLRGTCLSANRRSRSQPSAGGAALWAWNSRVRCWLRPSVSLLRDSGYGMRVGSGSRWAGSSPAGCRGMAA
ncbi:transposase family protein [Streptomyces sp. NPDC002809]|uniref:transposase family protein n=1 Tax=Streptomyces sp. NPDC002809 TaxID=3154433 RepID=UPI00331EE6A5